MDSTTGGSGYALGHSGREIRRLSVQARMFEPFTIRMLQSCGLGPGMRVLDVGSGAGDVAFLCASLVGPAGEVVGVDRSPAAVESASERARAAGYDNVTFVPGEPVELSFMNAFDAIVGRLVLMHQPDPVAMLRKLSTLLRAGGIVAFQEFDIAEARSFPPSPTFDRCLQWISAAFAATGTDTRMGVKLHSAFVQAGLPAPTLSLDAGIWGGDANPAAEMVTDVIRSLMPVLLKMGITTEAEVQIDSLQERIQQEILTTGGVAISPSLIGAWAVLT
jgi:SAM-dependent methyltransferase